MKTLTTAEVAKLAGVKPDTVRRWVAAGKLKCAKINQRVFRYTLEDVEEATGIKVHDE